jgi:hypothetical protein
MVSRGIEAVATLGRAARGVAGVFRADATEGQRLAHAARAEALGQLGAEFDRAPRGRFDRFVDGLNRLPRPLLAFGTLGLFVHAMAAPEAFAVRMTGLAHVPEPLWWLLGAIVGFYFGARELHHVRARAPASRPEPVLSAWHVEEDGATGMSEAGGGNPALADWKAGRG